MDLNLEWKVSGGFTSSNRENVSRNMSETGTSRNCAKSSKSSFCPSSFLARFPYSCRTFSVFLGLSLAQRGHRSHENDYVQNSLRTKFCFSRAWTLIWTPHANLQMTEGAPTATSSSLPQQWGPHLQLSHLCSSPVELPGVRAEVGGVATWLWNGAPGVCWVCCVRGKVERLTPASWPAWRTPAGRCRLAASAGPPPWPAGSLQMSNPWWAPPALWGRDGRSAGANWLTPNSFRKFRLICWDFLFIGKLT